MPSKYKNRRTDGSDSKKEYDRAIALRALATAGHITCLQEQVRYELLAPMGSNLGIYYVLDFMYRDSDGKWHYEDVKPSGKAYRRTEAYRMFVVKKKLMLAVHGIEIEEV